MKNNIDFIYEYSDLNLFQTRVKMLTGEYTGLILDFGGSVLTQYGKENKFTFEYQILRMPNRLKNAPLKNSKKFEKFLAYLLVDVIEARKNDPEEYNKLMETAGPYPIVGNIPIDETFYPNKLRPSQCFIPTKEQPKVQNLKGF